MSAMHATFITAQMTKGENKKVFYLELNNRLDKNGNRVIDLFVLLPVLMSHRPRVINITKEAAAVTTSRMNKDGSLRFQGTVNEFNSYLSNKLYGHHDSITVQPEAFFGWTDGE